MQEGPGTDLVADYESASHSANAPDTITPASVPPHVETGDNVHVYEALATDRRRIRLVTVWYGARRASYPCQPTESDDILCTIDAFEVDKAPSYMALSYTWGHLTPLHTIRLNGKRYSIRDNLFDFLKAFGARDIGQQSHYLWIDQLCINQSNKNERGHQVEMMKDIYRNARFVISWLDMSCLEAFHGVATGELNYNEMRAHMIAILSNQYFSRLWIVQEFLLAKETQFVCGDVWMDFRVLETHAYTLCWKTPSDVCFNAYELFVSRVSSFASEASLMSVLAHYSKLRCEDSRDQVYGLLGIVDSSHKVPEINYQKSTEQVYLDAIQILLTEGQDEPALSIVDCAERLGENMCLPQRHLSAIRKLLEDIRMHMHVDSGLLEYCSTPKRPVINAIGFDFLASPSEWWYEYRGVRYGFPVQSGADRPSQNSPFLDTNNRAPLDPNPTESDSDVRCSRLLGLPTHSLHM